MIGVDTNVLLRHFVVDDEGQNAKVSALFEELRAQGENAYIPVMVLCETIWALRAIYRQPKAQIALIVRGLLQSDLFEVQYHDAVERALELSAHGQGSVADYLIGEVGVREGCRYTATFDPALRNSRAFQLL